jgi:hypothetical protein
MQITNHMAARMMQRNFSFAMIDAVLDTAEWNARGDRLVLDQRQVPDLDQLITKKRRTCRQMEKEVRDLERLGRKGRVTVVAQGEALVTVYRNDRQG